jgi:HD-like signal output (HDOD) protein
MTHCEAGAALQRAWNFPERLCACAAGHHDPVKSSHPNPLHVVQIACRLADSVGFPELQRADLESEAPLPEGVRNHRELAPERLRERIARHVETVGNRDVATDGPQAGSTLYN